MTRFASHRDPIRRTAFTLIETIASIVVIGILGSVTGFIIINHTEAYADAATQAQLHVEGSVTLDRLVREFRSVEQDPASTSLAPYITLATTTAMDWNNANELSLSGTNLVLSIDSGVNNDILGTDVSALALDYFDEDNNSLLTGTSVASGDLPDIRRISVTITLTRSGVSETLRARVFLRAMMTGADA